MSEFSDYMMQRKVDACLRQAALVLNSNREGVLQRADSVPHEYKDKYLLADHLTNTAIACYLNYLDQTGLSPSALKLLKEWSTRRAVSLRFERRQRCKFVREIEKDVEDPTRVQYDSLGGAIRSTVKVITKIKEYIYKVEETYQLSAFSGVGDTEGENMVIAERTSAKDVTTRSSSPPFREATNTEHSVNITWLLNNLDNAAESATFTINRVDPACATPRRNKDVEAAVEFAHTLSRFCGEVSAQLRDVYTVHVTYGNPHECKFDLNSTTSGNVFNPVVPLFDEVRAPAAPAVVQSTEESGALTSVAAVSVLPSRPLVNQLLQEHRRSLSASCATIDELFVPLAGTGAAAPAPASATFFTSAEARLLLIVYSLSELCCDLVGALDFIEHMIRSQLVAAIGKEVSMRDFSQYMIFHNRKIFQEEFQPRPFSFAVRRSVVHSPEGQLQIVAEADGSGGGSVTPQEPIYTVSQFRESAPQMEFALNATSTVKFGGERHLHGWMAHRFSGQELPRLKLVAQARQFSSYIVLIGRIASAKLFQPKYGFIVQNKDEFSIPLELEQIPTAKEFKDAISSLSPEQQRFAKAFRSMQLESTLFAVCVIQIKPQLEKVLKLHSDSLTKEIKLTQDLMQLFIKYQIPTDLLSCQETGGVRLSAQERLLAVKGHVQAMQSMLEVAKEAEVAEQKQQRRYEGHSSSSSSDHNSHHSDESGMDYEEDCEENCYDEVFCAKEAECEMLEAAPARKASTFTSRVSKMVRRLSGGGARSSSAITAGATPPSKSAAVEKKMKKDAAPIRRSAPSTGKSRAAGSKATVMDVAQAPVQQPQQRPVPDLPAADGSQQREEASAEYGDGDNESDVQEEELQEAVDYTKYPNKLEEMYTKYDPESSLRPTIINPGSSWEKRSQAGLLAQPTTSWLEGDEQNKEKEAAFDLLDALTRSGALPIEHVSLHVVIAATHCFDQSVMDTLVQKNVNPIERVERSTLIMASALHDLPALQLVQEGHVERVAATSPLLLEQSQEGQEGQEDAVTAV